MLPLIIIFIVAALATGIMVVRQSDRVIIERLGRYRATFGPGIHYRIPIIDKPRVLDWKEFDSQNHVRYKKISRIDMREMVYDFPSQRVITKDNVLIAINALLYFQISDPVKAAYEIVNLPEAIEKLTQTTLRNVIGDMDLDHTLTSRDTINSKLRDILDAATDKWGVKVNRVELQDIYPPENIRDAMEKQMRAERDKRAMILNAEGEKQARKLEAEGIRDAQVSRAEGEKTAAILKAEGEAEALRTVIAALREGGGDPVQYLVAMRYIDALKNMGEGQNGKTVFMPYDASSVLATVGGIKELFSNFDGAAHSGAKTNSAKQ